MEGIVLDADPCRDIVKESAAKRTGAGDARGQKDGRILPPGIGGKKRKERGESVIV